MSPEERETLEIIGLQNLLAVARARLEEREAIWEARMAKKNERLNELQTEAVRARSAFETSDKERRALVSVKAELVAWLRKHHRCEECGESATRFMTTEGDGSFYFCDRNTGRHGPDFYCWETEKRLPWASFL